MFFPPWLVHNLFFVSFSQRGADAFYTGSIAENIVSCKLPSSHLSPVNTVLKWSPAWSAVKARGGIITLQDLKDYKAIDRTPVNITYRDNRIFSTVAPSSGAVVLSALKIFEAYPATAKVDDPEYDIKTHRLIQATRFGYGQRTNYGDPAYTANVSALERLSDHNSVGVFRLVLMCIRLVNSLKTLRSSGFERKSMTPQLILLLSYVSPASLGSRKLILRHAVQSIQLYRLGRSWHLSSGSRR